MAGRVRDIRTRFGVDGEKEYKAAMDSIDRQMRILNSEMNALTANYGTNQRSMEALTEKGKLLERQIEQQKIKVESLKDTLSTATDKYGEADKRTDGYRIKVNEAEAALYRMENALVKNQEELSRESSALYKFGTRLTDAGEKMDKLGDKMEKTGSKLTTHITVPAAACVASLGMMVNAGLEDADMLSQLSDKTGLTAERLQELRYVGAAVDVELETMTDVQSKLTKAMDAAQEGQKQQVDAFHDLGVAVTDSTGKLRNSNDVFTDAIDALSKMENPTERDAIALKLFGKSALELNPLIKAGRTEINRLTQEAHKNGAVLSNEAIKTMDEYGDSLETTKLQIKALLSGMVVNMMPTLQRLLDTFKTKGIPALEGFLKFITGLIEGFSTLSPGMQTFILSLAGIAIGIGPVLSGLGSVISAGRSVVTTIGNISKAISKAGGLASWLAGGPMLALAGAIAAATAALVIWMTADKEAETAVKELAAEIDNSAKSYRDNTDDINANAKAASDLVDELDALTKSGKNDNATKQRMATIIKQLNSLYPDLNLAIDEQTGLLKQDTKAVKDSIAVKKIQLQMQADEQRYVELLKERNRLDQEGADLAKKQAQYYKDGFIAHFSEWESLNQAIELHNQQILNNKAALDTAGAALDEYAQKQQSTTPAIKQETETRIELTEDEIAAYETYRSRLESLTKEHYDRMGGLHDYGIEQQEITAKDIKKNLDKQVGDYQEWQTQISMIAGRVSPEILAEMKKLLGPEYTNVLKELNGMTDTELAKYVKTFENKAAEAKNGATNELDALIANMEGKEKDIYEAGKQLADALETGIMGEAGTTSLAEALRKGGANAGQGLADGIRSKIGEIERAAIAAAEAAKTAVTVTIDAHSPSRVTKKLGRFFSEGFALGIIGNMGKARQAGRELALAAIPEFNASVFSGIAQFGRSGGIPSLAFSGAAGGTVQNSRVSNDYSMPMTIHIHGNVNNPADAEYMARLIRKDFQAQQRGRGQQEAVNG